MLLVLFSIQFLTRVLLTLMKISLNAVILSKSALYELHIDIITNFGK